MNYWKPLALVSIGAFALSVGYQAAHATPAPPAPPVAEPQPHMAAALKALYDAKSQLASAEHDKGGWRAAAQEHTRMAIVETEKGIAYADKH